MRKPSPLFLLRLEGDAASVTAEIGRLGRADLRWSPRKHGPSQVKCSSWTGSPCRGGDEQTACDTAEFQTNPTGPRKPFVGTCNSGESQHAVGCRRLHARVNRREPQKAAKKVPQSLLLPFLTVAPSLGPLLVQVRDVKTKHMWNKQTQANEGKQNNGLSCSCSGKRGCIKRSPEVSIRCPEPKTILSNVPLLFCAHV